MIIAPPRLVKGPAGGALPEPRSSRDLASLLVKLNNTGTLMLGRISKARFGSRVVQQCCRLTQGKVEDANRYCDTGVYAMVAVLFSLLSCARFDGFSMYYEAF